VLAACSSNAPGAGSAARTSPSGSPANTLPELPGATAVTTATEGKASPPQDPDLYDPDTIPKFELTLDGAAIAILSNPAETEKKTWVHGQFKFGAITFADVGVRRKGSSTYRVLPNKAALKVKFNKWVKGQKLYGLEELTLNNMLSDPTNLAERLTYHTFRSMGLPAPKANTAHLTINDEDYGIFANVETPDENFLARAFGGRARTLYEVMAWGSSWMPGDGVRTAFEIEVGAPGVPAGTMPDVDRLLEAVAAAKDETLLPDLAGRLHTRQWLRYCATEAVTGHYDGYAYGLWGSHNYFMAGDVDGKFALVPWSTDLTLSDRMGVADAANPESTIALARCKRGECWSDYKSEVQSVLGAYEALDLVNLAKKWNAAIDALVRSDPKREENVSTYEAETDRLYEWLVARPSVVRVQLGL
jgi:spore coat protein CotH